MHSDWCKICESQLNITSCECLNNEENSEILQFQPLELTADLLNKSVTYYD